MNGIPYMTLVELKLDTSSHLKIVDFRCDKRNIKHDFLADPTGIRFPWFKATSPTPPISSDHKNNNNNSSTIPISKSDIKSIDEIFDKDDDETTANDEEEESMPRETTDRDNDELNNLDVDSTNADLILNEILENLEPTCERIARMRSASATEAMLAEKDYMFVLFGSRELKANPTIVQSIVEFWRRFHKKHGFFVVYLEFNTPAVTVEAATTNDTEAAFQQQETKSSSSSSSKTSLSIDLSNVDWFTISRTDVKVRIIINFVN